MKAGQEARERPLCWLCWQVGGYEQSSSQQHLWALTINYKICVEKQMNKENVNNFVLGRSSEDITVWPVN